MSKPVSIFFIISFILNLFCLPVLFLHADCDKWIVITTIQYPTKAVKKAASIPGWRVVVVGDKKTPKDWHLENCDYLGVDDQMALGYEIVDLLPWNHYCRKNIGYLYAIARGAKIIYETDDDNELNNDIPNIAELTGLVVLNSSRRVANPYAYFGLPNVWPRGYPLNEIVFSKDFSIDPIQNSSTIGVLQGLVNKDPDVDAIYRLTQGSDLFFDVLPGCIIPAGTFCPYNTQNTLHDYKAFWGLFVPSTTPFRVCDIWRGYFVQRLLWDLNMVLGFTAPTAIQERNIHDYFKDFCGEQELYLDANDLLEFLSNWKDSSPTIQKRYDHLIEDLAKEGFVKQQEVFLLKAWMNDLNKVGYQFPVPSTF